MSYDTENENIFLQKVLTNVCKIKIKSNRLMKSESKVNGQMTACLFVKGKLVRHENSRERETDVASHWKFTSPKLRFKFRSDGGSNFTERDWINFIWKGSNKTIFQYCQNSCNKWLCILAVRGHTGEEVFQLEILGHVRTPLNWKEFVFHQGCSSNVTFVLNGGRIAGERRSRHQTLGILHSTDGETKLKNFIYGHLTKPRKVQYTASWKHAQDAVYWIHLGKAQRGRHIVLANQIACNHHIQHGATWLCWTCDLTTRWKNDLPAILDTEACSTYCSQQYLA